MTYRPGDEYTCRPRKDEPGYKLFTWLHLYIPLAILATALPAFIALKLMGY